MQSNPAGWFEIYVQDMERARAFYEAVFQTRLHKLNSELDMWAFPQSFAHYGAGGALVHMEGMPSGGNSTLVYFSCQDCAVEARRVVTAGGRLFKEKFSIGEYGAIAIAVDSEGNMFGLHSRK